MRKNDTIIFDLDGTLLNTLEDLTDSVNDTLARHSYPPRTIAEVKNFIGNGVGRLIELSVPAGTDERECRNCLVEFRRHYAANMMNKTKTYDGIPELLRTLAEENYRIAVVSNKFDAAVKELCGFYFGEYIKAAIGESENVLKKPAPDSVLKALEELGSTAGQAVYVGDSEVDAETAGNAGIPFIGVTWGFRDRAVLEQNGAESIINQPGELLDLL
jgi:phosphoglycolate phosphatase